MSTTNNERYCPVPKKRIRLETTPTDGWSWEFEPLRVVQVDRRNSAGEWITEEWAEEDLVAIAERLQLGEESESETDQPAPEAMSDSD